MPRRLESPRDGPSAHNLAAADRAEFINNTAGVGVGLDPLLQAWRAFLEFSDGSDSHYLDVQEVNQRTTCVREGNLG